MGTDPASPPATAQPQARIPARAVLINAVRRRQRPYRSSHPLAIPRTALALDLIRAYGALEPDELLIGRTATPDELARHHRRDYIDAVLAAEAAGRLADGARERFGLGSFENPYFDDLYTITATATGGSLQAAQAVLAGQVAFNPAGGMHHARRDRAAGFCYFNDTVLAALRLRDAGLRVLYVDIDAHHADGVEEAFGDDPRVFTLSLHMDTAYAYPFRGGGLADCGAPAGEHTTVNVPLPERTCDAEYALVLDAVLPRIVQRFRPEAIVLQAGADMIAADPLGRLAVSTQGFLAAVARVLELAPRGPDGTPRLMATGGGGYHPLLVARAWTGVWALLSGKTLPDAMPEAGAEALRAVEWDRDQDAAHYPRLFTSRTDAPQSAEVRLEVHALIAALGDHPWLRD